MELLWRYYEKNRDYAAAAKILNKLADKPRYVCKGLHVCVCARSSASFADHGDVCMCMKVS